MLFNQETYGKRIKMLRDEKGLTQEQLADVLHISDVHLRRLEAGRSTGSVELVVEIAEYFDVSLDYLLLGVNRGSGKMRKDILAIAGRLISIAEELG
ncbi:MAG: helix-turn-helix transcriptional regulator [Parasporobacterium sp.]|nr:helix-turn-helix transcriptional regulator [Parasporobacterium sp.]